MLNVKDDKSKWANCHLQGYGKLASFFLTSLEFITSLLCSFPNSPNKEVDDVSIYELQKNKRRHAQDNVCTHIF